MYQVFRYHEKNSLVSGVKHVLMYKHKILRSNNSNLEKNVVHERKLKQIETMN